MKCVGKTFFKKLEYNVFGLGEVAETKAKLKNKS